MDADAAPLPVSRALSSAARNDTRGHGAHHAILPAAALGRRPLAHHRAPAGEPDEALTGELLLPPSIQPSPNLPHPQAHAKVMFRDRVEFSDAIIAITLVSLSKLNIGRSREFLPPSLTSSVCILTFIDRSHPNPHPNNMHSEYERSAPL